MEFINSIVIACAAGRIESHRIHALAEALSLEHEIAFALFRRLASAEETPLPRNRELVRLAHVVSQALLLMGPPDAETLRARLDSALVFQNADVLANLERLRAARDAGDGSTVPPAESGAPHSLEDAYKARDWIGAALAIERAPPPRSGETQLLRIADTLCATGEFEQALDWCDRSGDPARKARFDHIRIRALVGLGRVDDAWRFIESYPAQNPPAQISALAAACILLNGRLEDLATPLRLTASISVTLNAVLAILREVDDETKGRARIREILRKTARIDGLSARARSVLNRLRFRYSSGGWPAKMEGRWARAVLRCSKVNQHAVEHVVELLLAQDMPRAAHSVYKGTPAGTVSNPTAATLAEALALQGDWRSCADIVAGNASPSQNLQDLIAEWKAQPAHVRDTGPYAAQRFYYENIVRVRPSRSRAPESGAKVVLHIGTTLAMGGTERQLQTVVRALAESDGTLKQIVVLAHHGLKGEFESELQHLGDRLQFLTPEGLDRELIEEPFVRLAEGPPGALARKAIRWSRINRLAKIVADSGASSVMIWRLDPAALLAAHVAGVRRIVVRAGSLPISWRQWSSERQLGEAEKFRVAVEAFRDADHLRLVANSEAALAAFRSTMGWPAGQSSLLYNSLDIARFGRHRDREHVRARFSLPQDAIVIGGAFRISPEKRPLLWLEAATRTIEVRPHLPLYFALAGDGPVMQQLASRVAASPLLTERVRLLGRLGPEIADFYSALDFLLHTSSIEGLPNALIEAQAAHCPVITVDAGGCAETIIDGVTGILVRSHEPGAIAAALLDAIADADRFHSRAARNACDALIAERFSIGGNLPRLRQLLGL